MIYFKCETKWI